MPNQLCDSRAFFPVSSWISMVLTPCITVAGWGGGGGPPGARAPPPLSFVRVCIHCEELGWSCIPLVVESFGAWGQLASNTFKKLASRLSVQVNSSTSTTLDSIYSRLNLSLVHALECQSISCKGRSPC